MSVKRRVRACYFNAWASRLEVATDYLPRVPSLDLQRLVVRRDDAELLRKARLDCDWYAENTRCFASLTHPEIEFLPAWVCGKESVLELARAPREPGEERWLITMGQQPQALEPVAGKVFDFLARGGVRHLFYAFDEASRAMKCFDAIAPHLSVLIHDESPLNPSGEARLRNDALVIHRSWVANILPFSAPFCEQPESKLLFLGSQLGLTPHRKRQVEFLQAEFGASFVAICDHSLPVSDRASLGARFAGSVCPEGRMFTTPGMSKTHTDRPFWSGCLGIVPICENSATGGRLDGLAAAGLIARYEHGDLRSLANACRRALSLPKAERRRIYDHFNRQETVGAVVAEAIAAGPAPGRVSAKEAAGEADLTDKIHTP